MKRRAVCILAALAFGAALFIHTTQVLSRPLEGRVEVVVTILLLQWLWRAEIALPPGLLPEGSVFDFGHYRQWAQNAFPDGLCSDCGAGLAARLKMGHALAAAECALLTICAASLRTKISHKGRGTE